MRPTLFQKARLVVCAGIFVVLAAGCSDDGDSPTTPDPGPDPEIDRLVPARTVVGDSVVVVGSDFGDAAGGRAITFAGATANATVLSWSDDEIIVTVPEGAMAGAVRIVGDGDPVEGPVFDTAPALISFENDLVPFFESQGCWNCHAGSSGSSGLSVRSPAEILAGGTRGPGIVPRRSGESVLIDALLGEGGIQRMPLGGDAVSPAQLLLVSDWIDQGGRDN